MRIIPPVMDYIIHAIPDRIGDFRKNAGGRLAGNIG